MKETIYKGTDFLSIEETLGDIITRMSLVNMDCHNDSEPSDSALSASVGSQLFLRSF
jgi:hypothetical protein